VPLLEGGAGSQFNTMWHGQRPTFVPSGILIHTDVWSQQTWAENSGSLPPFGEGELGPHLTQCGQDRGLPTCQVLSWSIQLFGHNRHGPKIGGEGCAPLFVEGEMGPRITQSRLGRGLPPYQVASWYIQPFGHNRRWPKIGRGCAPLGEGELGAHLTQCLLGRGLPPYKVAS